MDNVEKVVHPLIQRLRRYRAREDLYAFDDDGQNVKLAVSNERVEYNGPEGRSRRESLLGFDNLRHVALFDVAVLSGAERLPVPIETQYLNRVLIPAFLNQQ